MPEEYSLTACLCQCGFDIWGLTDQPTTCGKCGARTDFCDITANVQIHKCLNNECGYVFFTED